MSFVSWTTQAHDNWFARNLYAGYTSLSFLTAGSTSSTTATDFDNRAVKPTWPTMDDFMEWANAANTPFGQNDTTKVLAAERALYAARSRASERVQMPIHPLDANGAVDATVLCEVPWEVHLHTIMYAYKLYRRTLSPDGIIGSDAVGGMIRSGAWDHDAEALIDNWTVPAIG